jgi:hypothetical protein
MAKRQGFDRDGTMEGMKGKPKENIGDNVFLSTCSWG